jgi:hypothetical protein
MMMGLFRVNSAFHSLAPQWGGTREMNRPHRYLLQFRTRGEGFYLIGGCERGSGNQVVSMMDLASFGST